MCAMSGHRLVTEDALSAAMCIVAQTLNAGPLTPLISDVYDLEALAPNHFLLGKKEEFLFIQSTILRSVCPSSYSFDKIKVMKISS